MSVRLSTEETQALIEADPPEVVLLDTGFPWRAMTSAATDLRRQMAGRVVLIAYTSAQYHQHRPPPGFDHGLPKPATARELLNVLDLAAKKLGLEGPFQSRYSTS